MVTAVELLVLDRPGLGGQDQVPVDQVGKSGCINYTREQASNPNLLDV